MESRAADAVAVERGARPSAVWGRPDEAAMVEFQGVTKVYRNGVCALRDVTLRIAPEEFVFVVGATGTGKSTLTKMIYREELPTKGRVLVGGRDVTHLPPRQVPSLRSL